MVFVTRMSGVKQWRSQPKLLGAPKFLTLGEKQYFLWDTDPQSTKRLDMLKIGGYDSLVIPWLRLCGQEMSDVTKSFKFSITIR